MKKNLSLPGFESPTAGFEAPLEMLLACHHRIERQCKTLLKLSQHIDKVGSDNTAREVADAVIRYFDTAAVHHHEDEEKDLFPSLLECVAGSDAVCIRDIIADLLDQHRQLAALWQKIRIILSELSQGKSAQFDVDTLTQFTTLYQQHIEWENSHLLPMATRLMDADTLEYIGQSMRKRRGIEKV